MIDRRPAAGEALNATMLSRIVASLEARDLVERYADRDDRRAVRVQVTTAGKRLHTKFRRQRTQGVAGPAADRLRDRDRRGGGVADCGRWRCSARRRSAARSRAGSARRSVRGRAGLVLGAAACLLAAAFGALVVRRQRLSTEAGVQIAAVTAGPVSPR